MHVHIPNGRERGGGGRRLRKRTSVSPPMNISRLWVSLQAKWIRENCRLFQRVAKGEYSNEFFYEG